MSHNDMVEGRSGKIGKRERKALRASRVKKKSLRVVFDPSLSTPDLFCRIANSPPEPPLPVDLLIVPGRVGAVLIRKDNDMVLEHHQEVCDLLANVCGWAIKLVAVNA